MYKYSTFLNINLHTLNIPTHIHTEKYITIYTDTYTNTIEKGEKCETEKVYVFTHVVIL